MSNATHTPGPWRWEINEKHKSMQLVGGVPTFDLTIMDFERWGMGGAVARMRETEVDGMNIMHRCTHWAEAEKGREHHAGWFKTLNHPDARLIAAAPDLLEALRDMLSGWRYIRETHGDLYGVGWDRAQDKAESALAAAGTA